MRYIYIPNIFPQFYHNQRLKISMVVNVVEEGLEVEHYISEHGYRHNSGITNAAGFPVFNQS